MTLEDFFSENSRAALAFSGGADSAYLLYAAKSIGADIGCYCVKSMFQPEFELSDALEFARGVGAEPVIIELDLLSLPHVAENAKNRCYHCKRAIMGAIAERALEDGFSIVIDGTNASDEAGDRPGMAALTELGVRSPLRECGITKPRVRELSRKAGLFTWDKPAYACLATRIPEGEKITAEKLRRTEESEKLLFNMGFKDFRIRLQGEDALLQLSESELETGRKRLDEIKKALSPFYREIMIDSKGRRSL